MKTFPSASEPDAFGDGTGLLFWYGATHIAKAENSRRYRIDNRLEQLPQARCHVGRTIPDAELRGIETVLSIRPFVDRVARRQIDDLRARRIAVWGDYDDLLFDCPLDQWPGTDRFWQRMKVSRRIPVYRKGLAAFDGFTCTTQPLATALLRARPHVPVHVVPNVPSTAWIERGWARFGHLAWKIGDRKILRYLPGSPSHDADFATIEDALAQFLHDQPDVHLEIVGYLNFNPRKFPAERLRHRPRVPYEEFPAILLSTWVNLVPLSDSPYSQARSNIKILEAEAFGVRSVGHPERLLVQS